MSPPASPPVLAADPPARKRRPRWLFLPHIALALLALATCGGWLLARAKLAEALDAAPAAAARAGVDLRLGPRTLDGFPFRLRVRWAGVHAAGRSGWAVEAPALEAQAYLYAPTHWVLVAPKGLTVVRPQGGPVQVSGAALRASVAGVSKRPWRVALVGEGVRFSTPPGAHAFSLASAARVELYLKPVSGGAPGDGAVFLGLTDARAAPASLIWNFAPDAAVTLAAEGRLTHLAALSGPDWGSAVAAWSRAGGGLDLGHLEARGGVTQVWAAPDGRLGVDADGRLAGAVPLRLRQGATVIAGAGAARSITLIPPPQEGAAREALASAFPLVIEHGEARLGAMPIGPAPKVG